MLHNNHPIWDQDFIKTYPEYTIIFILFQEKDPVAKNNPDLHFNRSVVSTKKLLLRILFQIYSGYYYVHVCSGGSRSTPRKPPTCHKSLTNFITEQNVNKYIVESCLNGILIKTSY
jgi:hypothetical protein